MLVLGEMLMKHHQHLTPFTTENDLDLYCCVGSSSHPFASGDSSMDD